MALAAAMYTCTVRTAKTTMTVMRKPSSQMESFLCTEDLPETGFVEERGGRGGVEKRPAGVDGIEHPVMGDPDGAYGIV